MLSASRQLRWTIAGAVVVGINLKQGSYCNGPVPDTKNERFSTEQTITNWSSTHSSRPTRYYEPESAQEVCRVLKAAHLRGERIRPVGTALSPNGIGLSAYGNAISVSNIDYIEVDADRKLVTVGAGARVSEVLKKLNEHNLTLENFSSIQEQQVAGWTQVSAHGTGCKLSTVDDMIVRMKLATPTEGLLTLSDNSNPHLFNMARVGLGALGVVTELTLKCVPKFSLKEKTATVDSKSISSTHKQSLQTYRHVRYMWLPYTSKVVTVVSNPTTASDVATASDNVNTRPATEPLYELLLQINPSFDRATAEKLSFSQLRDHLLGTNPLDVSLIKRVNQAEALFWERMSGERTDDSTNILGFDCGGEQWVYEVCLPLGPLSALSDSADSKDIQFVRRVLQVIEQHQIPAPCPIEQRWTARSTAPMSPAFSLREDDVFSWVGIIMYMPPNQSEEQRKVITKQFEQYVALLQPLVKEYKAHCHWAKIELPTKEPKGKVVEEKSGWSLFGGKPVPETYEQKVANLQARISEKYPVKEFNGYRRVLDPKGILSNDLIDTLFAEKK